jgi:plasmid stabilization system protein ParE
LTHLPLRFRTVPRFPNYVLVHDPASDPLQIIRVLHGNRDLKTILTQP